MAQELRLNQRTVRLWLKRFNAAGLDGLRDVPHSGHPATYSAEQVGEVIATALTNPYKRFDDGRRFATWEDVC